MADNPLQDNTRAQEQQTEALQQLNQQLNPSSSGANVGDLLRTVAEIARLQARAAAESRPTPPRSNYSSPPPPSPPSPPGGNGVPPPPPPPAPGGNNPPPHRDPVARRLTDEEAARITEQEQRNKPSAPPPLAPHERMLHASIGATMERLQELQDYYRANPKAQASDLAAKGLRGEAAAHEDFIGKQFAGLSKEEQTKAMPAMQALEQRRKQVEEEELQRRKKLNEAMRESAGAFDHLLTALAHGNFMGAVGIGVNAAGMAGLAAAPLVTAITMGIQSWMQTYAQYRSDVQRGGEALSPSGKSTEEASRLGRQMEQARQAGEPERQRMAAFREQAEKAARRAGMTVAQNPTTYDEFMGSFIVTDEAQRARFRAAQAYAQAADARGFARDPIRGEAARERSLAEYYSQFARERGVAAPEKPEDIRRNLILPGVEPGITSAMGYQSELQINTLRREDATMDILKDQLKELQDQNALLQHIENATQGMAEAQLRWE